MLETASVGFSKMKMLPLALTKVCDSRKAHPPHRAATLGAWNKLTALTPGQREEELLTTLLTPDIYLRAKVNC